MGGSWGCLEPGMGGYLQPVGEPVGRVGACMGAWSQEWGKSGSLYGSLEPGGAWSPEWGEVAWRQGRGGMWSTGMGEPY